MDHERLIEAKNAVLNQAPHVLTAFVTLFTCQRALEIASNQVDRLVQGSPSSYQLRQACQATKPANRFFRSFFFRLVFAGHAASFYSERPPRKRKPVRLKPLLP